MAEDCSIATVTKTLKDAKRVLGDVGITISKREGEYRVNYRVGGSGDTVYFTPDLADAIGTGMHMARSQPLPPNETQIVLADLAFEKLVRAEYLHEPIGTRVLPDSDVDRLCLAAYALASAVRYLPVPTRQDPERLQIQRAADVETRLVALGWSIPVRSPQ